MRLICETLFPPRMSMTITFLTYSSYTSQSIAVDCGDNSSSLLIYCTSVT